MNMTKTIDFGAFGKNHIRGIYGEDVTEELFYYTGKGFVKYIIEKTGMAPKNIWITVSRDARLHSESLAKVLIKGITHSGANVLNLDIAPTPLGYYSEYAHNLDGAMIITASHNPKEYNGLKMTYMGRTLNESQIKEVRDITLSDFSIDMTTGCPDKIQKYDIIPAYIDEMCNNFGQVGKGVKVVVDSANATGGIVGPELYRKLGCDVIELYSEPNGNFPNHHPNPSVEATLDDLKAKVRETHADVGIAYDGDSDRIGVIDNNGGYLTGDKLLLIYATDIIPEYIKKGVTPHVVSEVKCSQVLFDTIDKLGGKSHMCKTGHGYIKGMMYETGAVLAGEMSGHTFFKDKYYGFDDAIYAGCRIIEIISKNKAVNPDFTIREMLKPFNEVFTSSEVRYPCPNELKKSVLKSVTEKVQNDRDIFGSAIKDIITLDGMRIVFDGGFALIRQSNTEPVFTLRFEAKTEAECTRFKTVMCGLLDSLLKH